MKWGEGTRALAPPVATQQRGENEEKNRDFPPATYEATRRISSGRGDGVTNKVLSREPFWSLESLYPN